MREYLEALQPCQVEELGSRLGIHDNWYIYLRGDYPQTVDELASLSDWQCRNRDDSRASIFNNVLPIKMEINNEVVPIIGFEPDREVMESNNYNLTVMIRVRGHIDGEGEWRGNIAKGVQDVGSHLVERDIPVYFPQAVSPDGMPVVHPPQ